MREVHQAAFAAIRPSSIDLRTSLQHPLQFLHALLNLRLQLAEGLEDFARRAVRDFGVDDFLVAVEREVVALRGEVGLGHAEALRGARVLALGLLAALTGVVLSVGSSWALAKFAFKADYVVALLPLAVAVFAVTTVTVLVGLATSRGIADEPPLEILRREG